MILKQIHRNRNRNRLIKLTRKTENYSFDRSSNRMHLSQVIEKVCIFLVICTCVSIIERSNCVL